MTISLATVPGGYLRYSRAKRYKAFIKEFPTAIDIMVRSVQAGLTLNEGLHTIITEVEPPISDEFQRVVDRMHLGESLGSAITVLQERLPLQEVHFSSRQSGSSSRLAAPSQERLKTSRL